MRILAIDYGTKRTGIAVTDPLQIIASGLCTVETPTLLAFQTMIDSGLKKKQRQNKALIDEISATIILQEFLSGKK